MADFMIATDNMADLPDDYCEKYGIRVMYLSYLMDGVTYNGENRQDPKEFYQQVRNGSLPVSSQITPDQTIDKFREYSRECKEIIFVAISSGLSGTFSSVSVAAKQVMQEIPGLKITVIDSLTGSLGEGVVVHQAVRMREKGASYEETVAWLQEAAKHAVTTFTVEDLFHLQRGGRVSKATAILGTVIQIKPLLHVDDEGHLVSMGKARGRRKSIVALVDAMEEKIGSWKDKNDTVFIAHGDCEKEAQLMAEMVRRRLGINNILINYAGPTIGTHTGPGVLVLAYLGDER